MFRNPGIVLPCTQRSASSSILQLEPLMSSLYKLSILGVRSFSPKDHETIQFGAPLTLICGQNGCGKTTIIECLKYATTGDLPPNSKGGAFVNDPAIADRLIVNAEIKLGYISVDGKLMTVTRNMQLTRKRGVRGSTASNTFKTLEGQLAVISRGHKTAISTKNAELDVRVPQYLGASKAILEYVIFCHQDDSLWPLSEAGVLKKRFDEIFEALKFTKVLDNLKSIKKEMATDIKLIEQSVQHAKVDKVRAQKIREKLDSSVATVDRYTLEIADLTVQIELLEKKADDLFHLNQSFQKTLSEYERLQMTLESTESNYNRLKKSIELLSDSDDELAHQLANFAEIQQKKSEDLVIKEAEKKKIDSGLAALLTRLQELARTEGSLESKRKEYEANLETQSKLSKEVSKLYDIEEGLEMKRELSNLCQLADDRYVLLVADNKTKIDSASELVREVRDKITKEEQHVLYCADDIKSTNAKIKSLKEKLKEHALDEDSLQVQTSELESLRTKLENRREKSNIKTLQEEVSRDKLKLSALEAELENLMRTIATSNKQSDLYSKIDLLKESKSIKSSVLSKSMALHEKKFLELTGSQLDAAACESTLDGITSKLETTNEDFQTRLGISNSEISSLNAQLENSTKNLLQIDSKMKVHRARILSVLEENEIPLYENLLQDLEEDHKSAVYNLNTFEVTKSFKLKALESAKSTNCCSLCNRQFNSNELSKFEVELKKNIEAITADKLTEDVEETMKELNEMKDIHIDVLQWRKLLNEVLALKSEIESLSNSVREKAAENDQEKKSMEDNKLQLEDIRELKKPIEGIQRLHGEISAIDSQILLLQDDLDEFGASGLSISELQKQQQQKNLEVKNLRQTITDSTEDISAQQKELAKLESQVKDKQLLISNMENSLNEALSLKSSIKDSEDHVATLKEKEEKIDIILAELRKSFGLKSEQLEEVTKNCSDLENKCKKELERISSDLSLLERILVDIEHYENHDEKMVEKVRSELQEVEKETRKLKKSKDELEKLIKDLEIAVNNAAKEERNIQDNVELRQTEKELDKIQESMNQIDIQNAEVEREKYQTASRKLRDQITELNSQHFGKVGEVKQINDQIQQLQNDLSTEFKNIDKQYHAEWIKLQTNLLVSNDLQTYSQALDNAIMKYHSMKMDEINRILRELWNQTYRGTDIDGIEIKCDVSKQPKGRSYNYRVVMHKKSSELDMRGRCSAGQKVLTSILIRLALAECFGTNCGMIALDEPTTNLDVENAESLAMALNNIIDFRKNQKNFQLIVITHDEKFLSHINGDRFTDNFYRIERDENQNSIIKSLPIHLMRDD